MINRNKLFSGLLSLVIIYTVMTIFELVFFVFVVCPVITNNIHRLLDYYTSKNSQQRQIGFDPSPMTIAAVLNEREYQLINGLNFNSYLIIVILIVLLISLFFYLYTKIDLIENEEHTERSPNIMSENGENGENGENAENAEEGVLTPRSSLGFSAGGPQESRSRSPSREFNSQNSNITRHSTKKLIYLRHAIRCAVSTISCLIIYQIFFYNYGLEFKYVASKNEMIVLFIENL